MKPTTPAQIEATISDVRALLDGDPLDTVHLYRSLSDVRALLDGDPLDTVHIYRSHLAIVLGALDEARAEAAARHRDFRAELDGAGFLRAKHGARDRETFFEFIDRLARERDEARAALAAAEMARDVAWVRASLGFGYVAGRENVVDAIAVGLGVRPVAALDIFTAAASPTATDAAIAAAIRAARGQS